MRIFLRSSAFVALAVGCSNPLGPQEDELAEAVARWEQASIDDYVFEFQRLCFCGGEVIRRIRIDVRSGAVTGAIYVDDGSPVGDEYRTDVPTIEALFEEIRDAIDREAHSLDATYDLALGYPTSVAIDYIENAVDEEMAFHVYSLQSVDTARRASPLPLATAATYCLPPLPSAPQAPLNRPRCPTFSSATAARTTPPSRRSPRTFASSDIVPGSTAS